MSAFMWRCGFVIVLFSNAMDIGRQGPTALHVVFAAVGVLGILLGDERPRPTADKGEEG